MRWTLLIVSAFAVLLGLVACSNEEKRPERAATPQPTVRPDLSSGLLVPRDQRLLVRDMANGVEQLIKRAPADTYYTYPRWSRDGRQIAYVLHTQYIGAANQDWGSNIAVSDPNGSNERIVFKRPQPGITVEGLAWSHDNSALYVAFLETTIRDGRFLGQTLNLERLDLATGTRRVIVEDAAQPTVAPDGSRIAFVAFSGRPDLPNGLWTANPDGSDRRLIVPATGRFAAVVQPRFSPDARSVAFAAVTAPSGAEEERPKRPTARWPWQPRTAAAHGLPMDIWTVPASGGEPQKLTNLLEDEPSPAWSPDGKEIAVIATGGLYQVPVAGGDARKIGLGGTQVQIDWR